MKNKKIAILDFKNIRKRNTEIRKLLSFIIKYAKSKNKEQYSSSFNIEPIYGNNSSEDKVIHVNFKTKKRRYPKMEPWKNDCLNCTFRKWGKGFTHWCKKHKNMIDDTQTQCDDWEDWMAKNTENKKRTEK